MAPQLFKDILAVAIFAIACSRPGFATEYHYGVPGAKQILAVTTGPADGMAVVYASDDEESDETTVGALAIIDFYKLKTVRFPKLSSLWNQMNVTWRKDGHHVLFETSEGVFEADTGRLHERPKRIVGGNTYGIALSRDESKLAFWKMGKLSMELVIRDAITSRILQTWTLPFKYGGEASGFEIVFPDERTVYARTFDNPGRSPLKSFDLTTGKVETVARDCMGLVASPTAIYYLDSSHSASALKKLADGKTETIASVIGYDDLRATAGGQWIALAGKGKSAIFDPASDRISIESTCDYMTALSDGTPLYINKATLSSDSRACVRHR